MKRAEDFYSYKELLSYVQGITQEYLDECYDGSSFDIHLIECVFEAVDRVQAIASALAMRTLSSSDFIDDLSARRYSLRWLAGRAITDRLTEDVISHFKSIYSN